MHDSIQMYKKLKEDLLAHFRYSMALALWMKKLEAKKKKKKDNMKRNKRRKAPLKAFGLYLQKRKTILEAHSHEKINEITAKKENRVRTCANDHAHVHPHVRVARECGYRC